MDLHRILAEKFGDQKYTLIGNDISGLEWDAANTKPKPSIDELKALWLVVEHNDKILKQIKELEKQRTSRRWAEALTTVEGKAWLDNNKQKIDELRAQLK